MPKIRRSRRVPSPRDSDYDHEISLVNHDTPSDQQLLPRASQSTSNEPSLDNTREDTTIGTLTSPGPAKHQPPRSPLQRSTKSQWATTRSSFNRPDNESDIAGPSIQTQGRYMRPAHGYYTAPPILSLLPQNIQLTHSFAVYKVPTPLDNRTESVIPLTRKDREIYSTAKRENVAVDVLYENERGGFLCGIILFSPRALGNLDPAPWTNVFHRKSRTDTRTTQPPDPSWQWAWPEWRVNRQEWNDDGGWEYSFAFSKCFSWHGPKWWSSFVRRRVWVRKRVRVDGGGLSEDPSMTRADYFSIKPVEYRQSPSLTRVLRRASRSDSAMDAGRISLGQVSTGGAGDQVNISNVDALLEVSRASRIDREKLEAVDNYLEHGEDLENLGGRMHEVMATFVYQASRRLLLTRLMQAYNQITTSEASRKLELEHQKTAHDSRDDKTIIFGEGAGDEDNHSSRSRIQPPTDIAADGRRLSQRSQALEKAVRNADEGVKRLAYWSDVKQMTEGGLTRDATQEERWNEAKWGGIDQSGPAVPGGGDLPG